MKFGAIVGLMVLFYFGPASRIGEAATPGPRKPEWRFRTCNLTAWNTGAEELELQDADRKLVDAYMLQEPHVCAAMVNSAQGRARAAGWHGLFGAARSTSAGGTSGGTAI